MSKLEEILQAEVSGEINEILGEAEKRAAKIISEAENRAAAAVEAQRQMIEGRVRAAIHQARSAAELIVASARIQAKGEVMEQLRHKVLLALEETATRPNYGEILQVLAEEALKVTDAAKTVVVHPDDKEKLSGWAEHKGLELKTDPEMRLGMRIVSTSGTTVENSLPERLQRVLNTLGPEVTQLLWE